MPDPNFDSMEQLRALAGEGKISAEEYDLLRAAMEQKDAEQTRTRNSAAKRLTKSRARRQFGGVCAGLARCLGTEPWAVRAIFVAAPELASLFGLLAFSPIFALGYYLFFFATFFALPLAYGLLFLLLPWDVPAVAPGAPAGAPVQRSGRLAGMLILLWMIMNVILIFFVPRIEDALRQGNAAPGLAGRFLVPLSRFYLYYGFSLCFPQFIALLCLHMTLADFPRARGILGRGIMYGFYGIVIAFILSLCVLLVTMRQLAR